MRLRKSKRLQNACRPRSPFRSGARYSLTGQTVLLPWNERLLGHKSGFDACSKADVLVLLGTDFPYAEFLPRKNTIVQIDIQPDRIGRRAQVDYGYAGDIRDTVTALLPLVKTHSDDSFLKETRERYARIEKQFDKLAHEESKPMQISRNMWPGLSIDSPTMTRFIP